MTALRMLADYNTDDDANFDTFDMFACNALQTILCKSGKFKFIHDICLGVPTSSKIVIMAEHKKTLSWIHRMLLLTAGLSEDQVVYIDGDVELSKRNKIVESFASNSRIKILLITTGVGGYGLNLDVADYLILVDVGYLPDRDMQAFSRLHRKGQKKTPYIFRLMSEGTTDSYVMSRKQDVRLMEQGEFIPSFFSTILKEFPSTTTFDEDERTLTEQVLAPLPYNWSPFDDFNPTDLETYCPVLYDVMKADPELVNNIYFVATISFVKQNKYLFILGKLCSDAKTFAF